MKPSSAHEAIASLSRLPAHQRAAAGLTLLRQLSGGLGAYLIDCPENSYPQITLVDGPVEEDVASAVYHVVQHVCEDRQARTDRFEVMGSSPVFITVPLLKKGRVDRCICLVAPSENRRQWSNEMTVLQWFALLFYSLDDEANRRSENRATQRIGGLLEAMEKAGQASDFPQAAAQLAEVFRVQAGCDRVALGSMRLSQLRLLAVSGTQGTERIRSEGASAIEAILSEAAHGKRELKASDEGVFLPSPQIQKLLQQTGSGYYWCSPLYDGDTVVGAWLFLWKETPEDFPERLRFLKAATPLFGAQLNLLHSAKPGAFRGMLRRLWKRMNGTERRLLRLLAAALGLFALAPFPLPVSAPTTLQPEIRRTVSAPFDGILRTARVEPGQEVKTGQLLADLDDREIRWQLADADARRLRAEKQADAAMSTGKVADSQVARLEAESLAEAVKVLRYRQDNLQIKAPMDGRVLQGDLKRSEGAIVRMGEMLFEIGSLDSMHAEIAVKESDIALIHQNAPVTLRFDSHPGKTWPSTLTLVSPRSEYRNGENVFVCHAMIENAAGTLRPGSQGRARIQGPPRPVIWYVLREPVNWVLQKLP